ncbi:hypothetical protein O0L34_g15578 [Tuta absoluta]|nr:hypothetical protein O0L34_g15578 [Tuta absoluta]
MVKVYVVICNDAEGTGGADLQRKLDLLNGALDAERAEQARRQMQYIAHSGYSEDSDYTSDLNYPVGQHPNCSASQFRTAAHQMHTPQRSQEVSRENSYERDEYHIHGDADPLYYNSQPRTNRIETWSQLHAQASVESAVSWRTAADWQSGEEQRRPSLERQNTLYDDNIGYGYDPYTTSTHIRDHTHLSQQPSYEEYFDSSSILDPYQASYVGDDSRQWDSGGRYFYDDGYSLTQTEYENMLNKRRSSVVQLPQVPSKQFPPSSRYSDYNEMAPYRPRPRRTTASLPATPSSTPKRGRALPVPPGSESGSIRGSKGRRLPRLPYQPPASLTHHVPYVPEPPKTVPDESYAFESYLRYQSEYQAAATDQYQDNTNYNTSYDEDGMQPFFDETPHATPPAAAQKPPWSESETQFSYGVQSEEDNLISKSVPSTIASFTLPQPPVTQQDTSYTDTSYQDSSYQQYEDTSYNQYQDTSYQLDDQQYQTYDKQELPTLPYQDQYQDQTDFQQHSYDYQYQEDQKQLKYHQQQEKHQQQQTFDQQQFLQQDQQFQLQQQQLQQKQLQQHQQQMQQQQQQQQQAQQKQPAQQLQTTVLTGAATLGSLMAGGAKKLGSFFGAAAAAVSAPPITQPQARAPATTAPVNQFATATSVTPFSSTITVPVASVPGASPSVPVSIVTTSTPVTLPRAPSLKRQESIQRPPVRRTRTLPDAPDEMSSSYDSAYDDEYNKTDSDQLMERDRLSLDRFHDEEYLHDTILEDPLEEARLQEEISPGLQKTSPTRTVIQARKPSVDSYHSQAPSIIDRKPSQSSFHQEDLQNHVVPTTQGQELPADKSKVSFQVDRTTFHEVPEEESYPEEDQPYDDQGPDYVDEQQYDGLQKQETFDQDEQQFTETDEQYQDEKRQAEEAIEFKPEQPKLTPKQRWHRAYNMIVNQLNVSLLTFPMLQADISLY